METKNSIQFVRALADVFQQHQNPFDAERYANYMKHQSVFFGIKAPQRRALQQEFLRDFKLFTLENKWEVIFEAWDFEEREMQYFALDCLSKWNSKEFQREDFDRIERLILSRTWWDSVDALASNFLGKLALKFPKEARYTFEQWRHDDNFWLQRSCLIYQLKFREKTDVAYLESLIAQFLPNKEFFIQKAIGWSLRELSKKQAEETKRILNALPIQGLALREASKYL